MTSPSSLNPKNVFQKHTEIQKDRLLASDDKGHKLNVRVHNLVVGNLRLLLSTVGIKKENIIRLTREGKTYYVNRKNLIINQGARSLDEKQQAMTVEIAKNTFGDPPKREMDKFLKEIEKDFNGSKEHIKLALRGTFSIDERGIIIYKPDKKGEFFSKAQIMERFSKNIDILSNKELTTPWFSDSQSNQAKQIFAKNFNFHWINISKGHSNRPSYSTENKEKTLQPVKFSALKNFENVVSPNEASAVKNLIKSHFPSKTTAPKNSSSNPSTQKVVNITHEPTTKKSSFKVLKVSRKENAELQRDDSSYRAGQSALANKIEIMQSTLKKSVNKGDLTEDEYKAIILGLQYPFEEESKDFLSSPEALAENFKSHLRNEIKLGMNNKAATLAVQCFDEVIGIS